MTIDPFVAARQLSPRRNSTEATDIEGLVDEQLAHFCIDGDTPMGQALARVAHRLYRANVDLHTLWELTLESIDGLDRSDRQAFFNAKRFLSFQLAKILDNLQNPLRRSYQSVVTQQATRVSKGPYPLFDNVTALFSANPVITRTATYIYACTEWVDDAFHGREPLHEIYSRLMNPTSVSLANHIVDLEAGPLASEYFAWNFNSGMAAIDGILSHLVGYEDVILASRNVYGGTYQLLHDWYGKGSNLNVAIHWFDGYSAEEYGRALEECKEAHAERLGRGRRIYTYIESPCNPHGYVMDVAGISRIAHENGSVVMADTTVGTPFLSRVLRREEPIERPDYVIHSYTKDISGTGTATAGVVIGRNATMFLPKGETVTVLDAAGREQTIHWNETLFWNVYYIKGAFLDADKAFDVMNGAHTLSLRMVQKTINTKVLAEVLAAHPHINVKSCAVESDPNRAICEQGNFLGLAAPLFTFDMEGSERTDGRVQRGTFQRFFDLLEPAFSLQVSLGQMNTVVLCPALTSHSEMSEEALAQAGIAPTSVRVSVGNEDPRSLLAHFIRAAEHTIENEIPGFCAAFLSPEAIDELYERVYLDVHTRYVRSRSCMRDDLA